MQPEGASADRGAAARWHRLALGEALFKTGHFPPGDAFTYLADYKQVALSHGLRACWSIPILTRGRKVLGTFAMYHREPREPTIRDLLLVDLITQTAALVIDRDRAQAALQNILSMAGHSTPEPQSSSSS